MKSWKELARTVCFKRYSRQIDKVVFELPDGSISDYYIKNDPPAVVILALTPNNSVLVVEEFRPGPMQVLQELPGGYIDAGESSIEAGRRELLEETGFAGDMVEVAKCFTDAYSTLIRTVLVARDCIRLRDSSPSQGEFIAVREVELSAFRSLLRSGRMTDVDAGYIGLDYLGLL